MIGRMLKRLVGVFLLRPNVFESIGRDPSATWEATIIVTIVAFLSGISSAISAAIFGIGFTAANLGLGLVDGAIADVGFRLPELNGPLPAFMSTFVGIYVSWLLWALVTWLIGEYIFKGDAGWAEMARITGYAKAPQVLYALGFIPGLGLIVRIIAYVWMLLATYVGIKQGLELSTGKTLLTIALSAGAVFLVNSFVVNPIFSALF